MSIDVVSTSGIWVRQVQCRRDHMCSKNKKTGNTYLSLQVYPFLDTFHNKINTNTSATPS